MQQNQPMLQGQVYSDHPHTPGPASFNSVQPPVGPPPAQGGMASQAPQDMFSKIFRSSFPLFTFMKIPVRMHSLYPIFFFIMMLFATNYGGAYFAYVFLLFGPILLVTVFIHELGHSFATRRIGSDVHGILLWPLGGLAFVGHASTPRQDLFVAIAGPLTHIPMLVFWLIVEVIVWKATLNRSDIKVFSGVPSPILALGAAVTAGAVAMQILLFAFNLLVPAYPLDGGRVLADALLMYGFEEARAAKITLFVSVPLALGMLIFGLIKMQLTTMMIGVWVLHANYVLYKHLKEGTIKQHPMFNFDSEANRKLLQDV